MRPELLSQARSIVARCAAIDWSNPQHDPIRAAAAYERWLAHWGLSPQVRWVADPTEVAAWRMRGPGVAQLWATMADSNPARATGVRQLVGTVADQAWLDSSPPSSTAAETAAAWAFAITSHMEAVEATWNFWAVAWSNVVASNPTLVAAAALLCPGLPWAPPPLIACTARDVLSACDDPRMLATLRGLLARPEGIIGGPGPAYHAPTEDALIEAIIALAEPMVAACEAGAFAHALLDREIVVLAAPSVWTDGRRLHRADGPALGWPQTSIYAWKGTLLPEELIANPGMITPEMIQAVADERLERAMIDIYAHTHGHRRCMQDLGGIMMQEDKTGRLWLLNPRRYWLRSQPGDIKIVEVANGTAEADGSHKTYWLTVPPEIRTAQQAVAWTYGLTPEEYDGLVVRT